nr:MAG TPA: hypothetical protein [Caudoviricetes sp.]
MDVLRITYCLIAKINSTTTEGTLIVNAKWINIDV